ncbi:MAG: putative ABC exporter domain-containing protein [Clostridia bacterium]|nr:putative ABC exporter domain-containing protein [Clostridia bacterium]
MRLLGYYLFHTIVNGIKKLFRTWVAVLLGFFVVCGLLGGVVGYTLGSLEGEYSSSYEEDTYIEEDLPLTPEDTAAMMTVLEMAAGGIILLVLLLNVYSADKSGTKIFTMPDVQFLFTAPMKPQSVLLFRVVLQMGATLLASVYLLFQIPNLVLNLGLDMGMVLTLIACWILTLALGQLLTVLVYTLIATHPRFRPVVRYGVFGTVGVLGALLYGTMQVQQLSLPAAAVWLFGSPYTRLIPGVGWLKAMVGFAAEGDWLPVVGCGLATVALCALIVFLTWRMKADFYEDALAAATEKQELLNAAAEGRAAKRKKERADRIHRDVLRHGQGGWMFLHKGVVNHHRFAALRVLSPTGITYFCVYVLASVLILLLGGTEEADGLLWVPAVVVAVIAFFRNLGNPVEEDMRGHLLYLVPDSPRKKLLAALLAGSYATFMDVLPGLVVATLLLQGSVMEAVGWLAFILTLDFMVSALGLLLGMGLPSSLPDQVHRLLQLMCKMLLVMLPMVMALVLGFMWSVTAGLLTAAGVQMVLGLAFFLPAGALLHGGRR